MDIFDVLSLLGGIALFLFGMTYMGDALKKLAGSQMKVFLSKVTSNPYKGFLVGMVVTMAIQSSTATSVMVLSFVNAKMLTLVQSIPLIIGANLGTTITAWIISLSSIDGAGVLISMLKPSTFTPLVIFIGVLLYRFSHKHKRQDIGGILIGFALLMYGMSTMSSSMSDLGQMPQFTAILTALSNPIVGTIVGCILAAVMQSSSAAVGIVQALALAGDITYAVAIPLIIGINIGQTVPVIIASSGTSYDAKRVANIHLMLNVTGAIITLPIYIILKNAGALPFVTVLAAPVTIAITHTGYKLISTIWQLPLRSLFEKGSRMLVKEPENVTDHLLDKRFLSTPALALAQCRMRVGEAIKACNDSFGDAMGLLDNWNEDIADKVHDMEEMIDLYQDKIETYLSLVSSRNLREKESNELSLLLRVISDCENVSDHIYHMVTCIRKMWDNGGEMPPEALGEIKDLADKTATIMNLSEEIFYTGDPVTAQAVVDSEKSFKATSEQYRENHLARLKKDAGTVSVGTYYTDILLGFDRIVDHLSRFARLAAE